MGPITRTHYCTYNFCCLWAEEFQLRKTSSMKRVKLAHLRSVGEKYNTANNILVCWFERCNDLRFEGGLVWTYLMASK